MKKLNLEEIKEGIIIQEVNCQGKFKTALNRELKSIYPIVYGEYKEYLSENNKYLVLGNVLLTLVAENLYIASIFGQFYYVTKLEQDEHETEMIKTALKLLRERVPHMGFTPSQVYIPEHLGCDLGVYDGWSEIDTFSEELGFTKVKHDPEGWNA